MNKKHYLIILLLLIVSLLDGCWDRRELESLGLVQAIGLDRGSNPEAICVTIMLAIPPKIGGGQPGGGGGGGSSGDETGTFLISMEAPSIYEAFNRINTSVNREITLIQTSVLLIGEELARHGIGKWVDHLVRFREMRRTLLLFICEGKAAGVMKVQPRLEKNPSEYFRDLASLSGRTGMFPKVTLNDFLKSYEAFDQENYIPLLTKFQRQEGPDQSNNRKEPAAGPSGQEQPQKRESKDAASDIRCIGAAIFKKDRMVGAFDIYETQVLLLLNNQFKEAMLTINDPLKPNNHVVFRLLGTTPIHIKYQHQKGIDKFRVKLKLEAELISIQSGIDYTQPKLEAFLGRVIAGELKRRIDKVIKKAQQEYNSDVFGFGAKVRQTFIISTDWEKYRWPERFNQAQIKTEVKVVIRRVGVQFQPPQLR